MKDTQEVRNCIQCENEFIAWKKSNRRHCSDKCARKTVKEKNKSGMIVYCLSCGASIYKQRYQLKPGYKPFCSKECANKGQLVNRVEIKCTNEFCSNIVLKTQNEIDKYVIRNAKIFCSVKCNNINRSQTAGSMVKHSGTKPELYFESLLKVNSIEYIHQYPIPWKKGWKKWFDFYIPKYNLLIEIDGIYWHGKGKLDTELNVHQEQSRLNDIQKSALAQNAGYNLLRIWEDEIDKFNIKQLLT
jgi:very-short-patch-repair endonuclease